METLLYIIGQISDVVYDNLEEIGIVFYVLFNYICFLILLYGFNHEEPFWRVVLVFFSLLCMVMIWAFRHFYRTWKKESKALW